MGDTSLSAYRRARSTAGKVARKLGLRGDGTPAPAPQRPAEPKLPVDFDAEVKETVLAVKPFTLTPPERLGVLIDAVRHIVRAGVPGAIAESGVWRGGSMLAAVKTLQQVGANDRDVWLYDSFGDLPPPTDKDVNWRGVTAAELRARVAESSLDPAYMWLPFEEVQKLFAETGYPQERVHFVRGIVQETIPANAPDSIALLRLDTDMYESTKHELEHLYPRVSPGGIVIIDDYGHWQGARDATDEYFASLGIKPFLHRIDYSARLVLVPPR